MRTADTRVHQAQRVPGYVTSILMSHSKQSPRSHRTFFSKELISKYKQPTERMGVDVSGGHQLSTSQAFWHCMSLVLGLGTLTVPYTLSQLGWIAGLCILASLAALSSHTSKLLCRCVDALPDSPVHKKTYSDLGEAAFGQLGRRAVDVILYVDLVASSALFLVFIATNLDSLFPTVFPEKSSVTTWILLTSLTLLPTVFMRLDKLSFLSAMGSYVMVAMVLAIVFSLFASAPEDLHENEYRYARFEAQAIGNQVFAFAMHGTLLTIYQDMKRPQDAEEMFDRVYFTGFLLKFIVGTSGYFLFAQHVSDQVTLDLPDPRVRIIITLAVTLKKWLTYALPLEPVARALEDAHYSRVVSRAGLVLMTVGVALWLPHFGLMQSLIGSLCAGCLVLVFPVSFFLKIVGPKVSPAERLQYLVLLGFSCVLVALAAFASMKEALQQDESQRRSIGH